MRICRHNSCVLSTFSIFYFTEIFSCRYNNCIFTYIRHLIILIYLVLIIMLIIYLFIYSIIYSLIYCTQHSRRLWKWNGTSETNVLALLTHVPYSLYCICQINVNSIQIGDLLIHVCNTKVPIRIYNNNKCIV